MRIALINENSQAAKNEMVYNTLKKVAESKGHTVDNYGMSDMDMGDIIHFFIFP